MPRAAHGEINNLRFTLPGVSFFDRSLIILPLGSDCEVNRLVLTNEGASQKEITVTSFVEFRLWNAVDDAANFQHNYNIAEIEAERGGSVPYHKTEYRERRNHYAVYAVNRPVDGFETERDSFCGAYRGL